jgi:KUP system potassium uptake protein
VRRRHHRSERHFDRTLRVREETGNARKRLKDRVRLEELDKGFWHVTVHFGFVEIPDLPAVLTLAKKDGVPVLDEASYYIERNDLISCKHRNSCRGGA